jgi:hypothetical protein
MMRGTKMLCKERDVRVAYRTAGTTVAHGCPDAILFKVWSL